MSALPIDETLSTTSLLVPFATQRLISANQRLHWTKKSSLTKEWRTTAGWCARTNKTPAFAYATITMTLHFADRRRRDVHNYYPTAKALIDGLVDAGVLQDDDDSHLTGPHLLRGHRPDHVIEISITGIPSNP